MHASTRGVRGLHHEPTASVERVELKQEGMCLSARVAIPIADGDDGADASGAVLPFHSDAYGGRAIGMQAENEARFFLSVFRRSLKAENRISEHHPDPGHLLSDTGFVLEPIAHGRDPCMQGSCDFAYRCAFAFQLTGAIDSPSIVSHPAAN